MGAKPTLFFEVTKFRLDAGGAFGELVGDVVDSGEWDSDVDVFLVIYDIDLDFRAGGGDSNVVAAILDINESCVGIAAQLRGNDFQ